MFVPVVAATGRASLRHASLRRLGAHARDVHVDDGLVQPNRAVVSCRRCNQDRGCLTVEEWRAVIAFRRIRRARHVLGGVTVLCWWMPTLLLALGALWGGRLRFKVVMSLGRALVAAG